MQTQKIIIYSFLLLNLLDPKKIYSKQSNYSPNVKVVCTAALINNQFEMRKNEYIHSLNILKDFGYANAYIIEAIKKTGPTFLDEFSSNVFYSTENNPNLRNKGVNEGKTMLQGLKHFNLDNNAIILKLTGRYFFSSNKVLQLIENNPEIDVFVKRFPDGQVFTGCFAMKCHYLIDFLEHLDYNYMETNMINIEYMAAQYIYNIEKNKNAKIMYIDSLDITANIFGNGQPVLAHT